MTLIQSIPFELRLAVLFVAGLCLGSLVNLAVYRLAWHARSISPWSAPPSKAPARRRGDRIPVTGWFGLRREAPLHGPGFWIRPMLVELCCGVGLAALYWWELGRMALLPMPLPEPADPELLAILHVQFACHALLFAIMLAASLIDVDEQIIPDTITIPGTLLALLAAAACPWSLLPDWDVLPGKADALFVHLVSPRPWPPGLDGFPLLGPLALGLGCWWLWCLALSPRTWYSRHGRLRAIGLCLARLRRERATRLLAGLGLVGSAAITAVWFVGGDDRWMGLLTALVGMAASGGLVWLVRVIGTVVLGREAMGFGDVTLMAMLGAFLGWQACLMIFFLAPFAGLVIGLAGLILRRGTVIPYGPFLCLAAAVVIVRWQALWNWALGIFQLGLLVPAAMGVCLALMAGLLGFWRLIKAAFR